MLLVIMVLGLFATAWARIFPLGRVQQSVAAVVAFVQGDAAAIRALRGDDVHCKMWLRQAHTWNLYLGNRFELHDRTPIRIRGARTDCVSR